MDKSKSREIPNKYIKIFKYISYNVWHFCKTKEEVIDKDKFKFIKNESIAEEELNKLLRDYEKNLRFAIPIVVFTKMITYLVNIWNHVAFSNQERFSNYHPFVKQHQAKHGRRIGRYGKSKEGIDNFHYLTDIINNLEKRGLPSGVSLLPNKEASKIRKENIEKVGEVNYYLDAENLETSATYSFPITNSDKYLEEIFKPAEIDIIKDISESLCELNFEELRAIGTHSNYSDTKHDIIKEYKDIFINNSPHNDFSSKRISPLDDLLKKVQKDEIFIIEAKEVLSYLEEAYRKSTSNKHYYISAYNKITNEISKKQFTNRSLLVAFNDAQMSADDIWTNEITSIFQNASTKHFFMFFYIYFIGYFFQKENRNKNPNRFRLFHYFTWDELLINLDKYNINVPCRSIKNLYFEGEQNLKPEVKSFIISSVNNLKSWIEKNIYYGK